MAIARGSVTESLLSSKAPYTDPFGRLLPFGDRQEPARGGQFHRLSSVCLKLEGVYRSRGRFRA